MSAVNKDGIDSWQLAGESTPTRNLLYFIKEKKLKPPVANLLLPVAGQLLTLNLPRSTPGLRQIKASKSLGGRGRKGAANTRSTGHVAKRGRQALD